MSILIAAGTLAARLSVHTTGRLREWLATASLLLLQSMLRDPDDIAVHVDDDDAQVARARAELSLEALSAALTSGLVHLDNGSPLIRPVVVRTSDDRVDAVTLAFHALTELDGFHRDRVATERAARAAEFAAARLARAAEDGRITEVGTPVRKSDTA